MTPLLRYLLAVALGTPALVTAALLDAVTRSSTLGGSFDTAMRINNAGQVAGYIGGSPRHQPLTFCR
jgi:hypothetical protein